MAPPRKAKGDTLTFQVARGFTCLVERPPMQLIRALTAKAEELHPTPEPPCEDVTLETGAQHQVYDHDDPGYKKQLAAAQNAQNEYLLDYFFKRRLQVEGYDDEERKQELIDRYAGERDEMLEFGSLDDELLAMAQSDDLEDQWQFTLRTSIFTTGGDYALATYACMSALDMDDITEAEICKRVKFLSS